MVPQRCSLFAICAGTPFFELYIDDGRFVREIIVHVEIYGTFSWKKIIAKASFSIYL